MSKMTRLTRALALGSAFALAVSLGGFSQLANADTSYDYTPISQNMMKAVVASSQELNAEGTNGPLAKTLDGDKTSYWHSQWSGEAAPAPHRLIFDLGKDTPNLGQVTLTPREGNGSGRFQEFSILVNSDAKCAAAETVGETFSGADGWGTWTQTSANPVTVAADPPEGKQADVVVNFTPTAARCVMLYVTKTWGGDSSSQTDASLAEFNAATASQSTQPSQPAGEGPKIDNVSGALTITDGKLTVRTHPDFPQIIDYQLAGKQLAGNYGQALTTVKISGQDYQATVAEPVLAPDAKSVSYPLTFAGLDAVSMDAVLSVEDGALTYKLTNIKDPNKTVSTIEIPGLNLVSLNSKDAASNIYAAKPITGTVSTNRANEGDVYLDVANAEEQTSPAWMIVASNSELSAGFETNAIPDGKALETSGDVRFNYSVKTIDGVKIAAVSPASWVYRSTYVTQYDDGTGIGVNDDPFISVKLTGDANNDAAVNWQDGAIVTRDILTPIVGQDDVKNYVVTRIPFNFGSQATHPYLRTLDDTKRVSLATDGLGQQVLLKGYQGEGHDSAHGDYAGHYNKRAGDLKDMQTLVNEGKNWNATFGIHVNATETYSEANCLQFRDEGYKEDKVAAACQLADPLTPGWEWMNQAYRMNMEQDLASSNVLDRVAQLREDFPADENGEYNLNWLYWDVYQVGSWQADRFSSELQKAGWRLGSEYGYAMPRYLSWSHWAADDAYGEANRGLNSTLIRFVENSYRDNFNDDPILGLAKITEFEGWQTRHDSDPFFTSIWQTNLPTKFLQQSEIMSWETGKITFKNGTVATLTGNSSAQRTISYDGATVYEPGGDYLLPWSDGGQDRLYYWNPGGEARQWQLTDSWAGQSSLKLYRLGDTGKVEVGDVAVKDGSVSLPATDADTAYVLYSSSELPDPVTPNWGQGSLISDPGFFSGTLNSYVTQGNASVIKTDRGNFQAQLGQGQSSIMQQITVDEGDYSAWAWIEIQPGQSRGVQVGVIGDGVSPAIGQAGEKGSAVSAITSSSAKNATASDEKYGTYFQRVPIHFHSDGTPFWFFIQAGEGDAVVSVDDLRIVKYAVPQAAADVANTLVFQDYENTDIGYWPFVTGSVQTGDSKTQLAEKNEPYSQSGWWGIGVNGLQEGQKYIDNVLDGDWSLLAHEENNGLILRTTQASVPLFYGHSYQLTFEYQSGFADSYQVVLGHDTPAENAWTENIDRSWAIPQARGSGWSSGDEKGSGTAVFEKTISIATSEPSFIGITKNGSGSQDDLAIDNLRIVDLGTQPMIGLSATDPVRSADAKNVEFEVTSSISVPQGANPASNVKHAIEVPEGWTLKTVEEAADKASVETPSVAKWLVTAPLGADPGDVRFTGSWNFDGKDASHLDWLRLNPGILPLQNPIGGADLKIVSFDSEETVGEQAPASAAIDGKADTFWHTKWSAPAAQYPHEIVLQPKAALADGAACVMSGFEYTARQNAANGRVKGYEIYVSVDGENWGDAVAKGDLANVTTPQVIEFDQPVQGSFVKMVQTSAQNGSAFGGAAEIRLGGICGSPTQPSVEPSSQPSSQPSASTEPSTTTQPTNSPSVTISPSTQPSSQPSNNVQPTTEPSDEITTPTITPSVEPSVKEDAGKDAKRPGKLPKTGAVGGAAIVIGVAVIISIAGMRPRKRG